MYYILFGGKVFLLLVVAYILIRWVQMLVGCKANYTTFDILHALKPSSVNKKNVFFVIAALVCVMALLLVVLNGRQNASLNISLNYPEASKGLNPNGSRYNASQILSDDVLQRAIEYGGFQNIEVEDLKSALHLTPIEKEEAKEGEEEAQRITTQFELSFEGNRDTGNLTAKEAVYAVAYAYREWFIDEYAINYDALNISFDDIQEYDYLDLKDYFSNAIMVLCDFSDMMSNKDAAFRSTETDETFYSINSKAWDLYNVGLENLSAYISNNGLSQNRDSYLSRLRYEYTSLCKNYRQDIQSYDVRIEAIQRYDNDMATVVYIPTYDTDNTFYMSKTKIGIDHFSEDASVLSESASETLADILDTKHKMDQLINVQSGTDAYLQVEEIMRSLEDQILNFADVLEVTAREYEKRSSNGYISVNESVSFGPLVQCIVSVLIGVLVFALLYMTQAWYLMGGQKIKRRRRSRKNFEEQIPFYISTEIQTIDSMVIEG